MNSARLLVAQLPALLLMGVAAVSGHVSADPEGRITLEPIPPPENGKFGFLGFAASAPWMTGRVILRMPETLSTWMGLHFIDHDRSDMPPLSHIQPFPRWQQDADTGEVSYECTTAEGIYFSGRAMPLADEIRLQFRVRNDTDGALRNIQSQMCLVLNRAPEFGERNTLANTYTWIDGQFTGLDETTPSPEAKGRDPWILVEVAEHEGSYTGPREHDDLWWVVDQMADHPIIARTATDGRHLVAIDWNRCPMLIMTNTWIPCLHAGPTGAGSLEPGQEYTWRGRIYLMDNDPDEQLRRHRRHRGLQDDAIRD